LVSFAATGTVTDWLQRSANELSLAATGASFTGETVTVTVAVSTPPKPSLTVYAKVSTPFQLASGVKGTPVFLCCKGCEAEARAHPDETMLQFQKLMNRVSPNR